MTSTVSDTLSYDHKFYHGTGVETSKTKKAKIYSFHDDDDDDNGDYMTVDDESIKKISNQESKPARIPFKYIKSFQQLLKSIGFMNLDEDVYKQLRSLFPLLNHNNDSLTIAERNLANIYKCDVFHEECFFTSNDSITFCKHIDEKHSNRSLFCFYCNKSDDDRHKHCSSGSNCFENSNELTDHITEKHSCLAYQCNLCFYRAYSFDHVLFHQALEHSKNFFETIKRLVLEKKDEPDHQLNVFEKTFLNQVIQDVKTSDDETEIEESFDDQIDHLDICKIISCSADNNDDTDYQDYIDRFEYKPEYQDLWDFENYPLHCAYCNESRGHFNYDDNLWIHFITCHPEHPILSYDLQSEQNKISAETKEKDVIQMIDELQKLVYKNSLPRMYGEKMMLDAFAFYGDGLNPIPKGMKRKQNELQENMVTPGEQNSNDQTGFLQNKRRRIFERFIPESVRNRAKTAVGVATTAVVALGFYHFAQYLPIGVQRLLENKH
uniref:Uncharacterized protein LOC113791953 n=1 Tax=Dermatophagoides pteronyssinus TaxID=6956 RepID=A0A6P6XXG9_DERPT|nr:uncharacterized protein LOC113791953 [Dermatophagoides pteronyssinus]XP_027197607.1 uncharacterized protein LOC113791953 [Dermatophagoides pteronyssinus]